MKILLTILLFIGLAAIAQTPFVTGSKYNAGATVIDNNGVQWRCLVNTKAKMPPAEGATWTRVTLPVSETKHDTLFVTRIDTFLLPAQLDPNGITRGTIDSLKNALDAANSRIKRLEVLPASLTGIESRIKTLEKDPGSMFLKVSMEGYSLLKVVGDTLNVRALQFPGKKVTETNSIIKVE